MYPAVTAMEAAAVTLSLAPLRARLPGLMLRDQHRLARRVDRAAALRDTAKRERALGQIRAELAAAEAHVQARRHAIPAVSYPPELPVSQLKDEIAEVIRDHQVVIIAGETGSGKTTQLPKICLELGRGVTGQIGHTQPRRIAARTVAERIAAELGIEPGTTVGYKVRFTDSSGDDTIIKLMTDGILLAEMQRDRQLLRYDTLIIDEAHERSLNIDFILGYLKRLLPSRPDLKVIITSATIDPERFSMHFAGGESGNHPAGGKSGNHPAGGESGNHPAGGESGNHPAGGESGNHPAGGESGNHPAGGESGNHPAGGESGNHPAGGESGNHPAGGESGNHPAGGGPPQQGSAAPVIEVSGRTYAVETRYRPLADPDDPAKEPRDQVQGIDEAVSELLAEGPGDILVFLSGEREIRDTADALADRDELDVLPLYARLSAAEQHRVFAGGETNKQSAGGEARKQGQPHRRRVVLATNIAETSLTVPGIKYVIDPGTARISRYSQRTKVQRLPIEAISQASANQRKGRCGRTSDGVCIRLYSEEDFASRPEFTDPEILRTHLASVILQMAALDLGEVAAFPFIDPPDQRNVRDGVRLLEELGAFDPAVRDARTRLTPLGRKLAQLPVGPRLARMVLEAERHGCVREVMVIAAALSIQDPRERPVDAQQAAAEKHGRFVDKESDFLAYLNLWRYLRKAQEELSSNQFRKLCRTDFLNYLRVREWQDVYSQLRQVARTFGVSATSSPDDADGIHRSLLAGLLSHIGLKDPERQEYEGARNARFAISPGSALFKKSPRWVLAAELVETSRLWGRVAARVEPEWVESLGQHLVKRTYSEPHWEQPAGAVMAFEKVTLYGLPIVASRRVNYGRIDPEVSRELFIRHALVQGEWETHHQFFHANRRLLEEVSDLEARARRRDILVDDQALFDFYDRRLPAEIVSTRHFDAWWKRTRASRPGLLSFEKSMLIKQGAGGVSERDYPDVWRQGRLELPLT